MESEYHHKNVKLWADKRIETTKKVIKEKVSKL